MTPWTNRIFIIGEAGVNHNGDAGIAQQLIDVAAAAGCDAVKFQTFRAEALASRTAATASYQKANTGRAESQYEMLKRLELPVEALNALSDHARAKGVLLFSTAFDLGSVEALHRLAFPLWKIPSGEITNYPYLVRIASFGTPVVLSTGMATLSEIDDAVRTLLDHGVSRADLCILHCNTEYPTPPYDVNLSAMVNLGAIFGTVYGYSDHTSGIEVPIAAAALGAKVLEKHFTLDRTMEGPDHKASLEPRELTALVSAVRNVEQCLGNGIKQPTASEAKNRPIARKSLVAARDIVKGEPFTAENIAAKRPGTGISPMRWGEIIGRPAPRPFAEDELIVL